MINNNVILTFNLCELKIYVIGTKHRLITQWYCNHKLYPLSLQLLINTYLKNVNDEKNPTIWINRYIAQILELSTGEKE